jgi:hypothetical protein
MAPFNTHFLIAEKIWPHLTGPWQPYYGQFCFGCVAPDVDKASAMLTQKDTHFFDRTTDYELMATSRSATFLRRQDEFLGSPFTRLAPEEKAFVLGYLCHLCVDEVSKHMWRKPTWQQLNGVQIGVAFAALDELARQQTQDYAAIVEELWGIKVLAVIPRIPLADLARMQQGVGNFARAEHVDGEYLALLDLFDHPSPAEREQRRQKLCAQIDAARRLVNIFRLDTLVQAAIVHTLQRFDDLFAGRIPQPGYPSLDTIEEEASSLVK